MKKNPSWRTPWPKDDPRTSLGDDIIPYDPPGPASFVCPPPVIRPNQMAHFDTTEDRGEKSPGTDPKKWFEGDATRIFTRQMKKECWEKVGEWMVTWAKG